ncbi:MULTISPECIES: DUF4232 domain-containing protein [unclassified Streptomyces]|uniref:DUF4232 domain-containing protein n=1 Tax=unclassified Streptomyces TaxID=2593676 RepID=UPI0006FFFA27|nr:MULTISPECIES: DUF4232 domain-containing protein [unclassified Streptomyces]KQX58842.1 hypothetical protein ASD33_00570 [Streptomyces sp. Root1304]KRB00103.1 hypothetical protein ASE09_00570 [Streptomyces sp. Root66D1]
MRHHHKTTVLAAAAVAALSLGLTACGGDDTAGAKDAGSAGTSKSAPATTESGAASAGTADQTTAKGGSGSTGGSTGGSTAGSTTGGSGTKGSTTGGSGSSAGGTSSTKAPACASGDIKVTAAKADEVPTEHIVLTATNTSGRDCTLLEYPLIAFGPIQTAKDVPAVAKSKPAAPIVLKAGAPAYANVRIALGGAHEDNKVVNEFNVNLFATDGPAEGSIVVKSPAGGLAVDEAAAKTGYWTYELRNGADEF